MTGPAALQAQENLLADVIRDGPAGVVLSALDDGQILDVNDTLPRWIGYSREELVGQSAIALGLWADPARRDAKVSTLRAHGHVPSFEAQVQTKSGLTRRFATSMTLAECAGRECALIQIDDQRKADAEKHAAEARFRSLVEQIPAITYTEELGDTGTYFYVSPQVEALLGYSAAEVMRTPNMFVEKVHPDDREAVQREGERTTATGEPFRMEYRLQARDGRWVHLRDEAVLIRDDDGNPLYWQGVLVDATEQRQAEEALRQSERGNRASVVSALDCVIGMDQEGRITEFNPAAERTFGYRREEAVGQMLADLIIPPDLRESHRVGLRRFLETGHGPVLDQRIEISAMRADGSVFPVELTVTAVSEPEGQWFLGYVRDIASRIETEAALRASQERFRALVQNSSDIVVVIDPDGTRRFISPSIEQLMGYRPEELLGGSVADLLHPDDVALFQQAIAACVREGGQTPPLELRFHHRDGSWRYFETVGTNLLHVPDLAGVVLNSRGISDRKVAEVALRESERRFRSAFDHAPIGFALVATDGRFRQVNRSLCELVGHTERELLAKTFQEITHPDDLADDLAQTARLWSGEIDTYQLEKRYLHKDGHAIWIQLTVSAVREEAGSSYAIAQIEDISTRRHLDLERATMLASEREYTRQLRELTETRADLTAMIAHELRSPIAAVRMLTATLATGELAPAAEKETLASIQAEIDQLDRLAFDVAASAAAEREDFSVQFHPVSLTVLLDGAATFARTALQDHAFSVATAPDLRVWCDPERISQVLRNVLDNAAKHTPPGTPVTLSATVRKNRVRIEISNRGPLIPAEDLSLIFEKFGRGREAASRRTAGAGLGLYLSRRIVEAHGTELTVESTPERGTVFGFALRIAS